jgi:protein TonB
MASPTAPSATSAQQTQQQQAQQQQAQQQQSQPKPGTAEASRVDTTPAPETPQPARPTAEPPKPFSLAARIRQPEATDLPEAPSVDPSGSGLAIRPSAPGRLPAPPPPVAPPPQAQAPAPTTAQQNANLRIGGKVQEPKLLRRIDAVYPPMARQARIGGVVRLQATIGKDGKVKKVEVKSGPPLLRTAAIDAVQKWVYSPSLLNGSPVEATTDVDVSFNLTAH